MCTTSIGRECFKMVIATTSQTEITKERAVPAF
jgi:hypothetical protein